MLRVISLIDLSVFFTASLASPWKGTVKTKKQDKNIHSVMPRRTRSLWEELSRLFVLKIFPWRICKAKGKVIITAALGEKDLEFDDFPVSII